MLCLGQNKMKLYLDCESSVWDRTKWNVAWTVRALSGTEQNFKLPGLWKLCLGQNKILSYLDCESSVWGGTKWNVAWTVRALSGAEQNETLPWLWELCLGWDRTKLEVTWTVKALSGAEQNETLPGLCKLVGISLWHGFLCQNKMKLWMDCGNFLTLCLAVWSDLGK